MAKRVAKSMVKPAICSGATIPLKGETIDALVLYIQATNAAFDDTWKNSRMKRTDRTNSITLSTISRNVLSKPNICLKLMIILLLYYKIIWKLFSLIPAYAYFFECLNFCSP